MYVKDFNKLYTKAKAQLFETARFNHKGIGACAALLACTLAFCAHNRRFHADSAFRLADEACESLRTNRISVQSLKTTKIGKSGYYYLLDNEGTAIFHPNSSIEGINFSGMPMIKSILEKKSGCYIHFFDGMEKIVIFRNAHPKGILCLTISADEVGEAVGNCERFE